MSEQWVRIAVFPLDQNLGHLNKQLVAHSVVHRFTEEKGQQFLWVSSQHDMESLKGIIEHAINDHRSPNERSESLLRPIDLSSLFASPITSVLLLLGMVGYLAVHFELYALLNVLIFHPFDIMFAQNTFWRLVTPVFIHFGAVHIIFNSLWIWVAGKRLEAFLGWKQYILLFVFSAVVSNVCQFVAVQEISFGGLSGVVYAYLGCAFLLYKRYQNDILALPPGIFPFMLFWLILGFSGIIDKFIQGQIANWAHLGGLLAGLFYGLCYSTLVKKK